MRIASANTRSSRTWRSSASRRASSSVTVSPPAPLGQTSIPRGCDSLRWAALLALSFVLTLATPAAAADPKIGKTIKADGWRVTVHEYRQPAPATLFPPDEGYEVASIDVEACNLRKKRRASPSQWTIELASHRRPGSEIGDLDDFDTTTLRRGDCVRGWTSFWVREDRKARWVVFDAGYPFDGEIVKWRIPAG